MQAGKFAGTISGAVRTKRAFRGFFILSVRPVPYNETLAVSALYPLRSTRFFLRKASTRMSQNNNPAKARWRLPSTLFLVLTPLLAIIIVPWYGFSYGYDLFEWAMFGLFMILTGTAITAGYHRLWSHKTYEVHALVRVVYAIWGACSLQNTILHWASDHRRHHQHTDDNERDPYSAGRGFWYSHIGWIMRKEVGAEPDFSNVKDLMRDPVVMWQYRYYPHIATLTNVGIPAIIGWLYGDIWGTLLLAGLLRIVVNHHFTFFINSLAHIWGTQNYGEETSARDNGFLAYFTYGEGYHNYHHRFQYDFRNGVRWWHFDPSKWMIRVMEWLGIARKVKFVPSAKIEATRIATEYKRALRKLEERYQSAEWRSRLENGYNNIVEQVEEFARVQKEWYSARRKNDTARAAREQLKERYREVKNSLKRQRQEWRSLLLEVQKYAKA